MFSVTKSHNSVVDMDRRLNLKIGLMKAMGKPISLKLTKDYLMHYGKLPSAKIVKELAIIKDKVAYRNRWRKITPAVVAKIMGDRTADVSSATELKLKKVLKKKCHGRPKYISPVTFYCLKPKKAKKTKKPKRMTVPLMDPPYRPMIQPPAMLPLKGVPMPMGKHTYFPSDSPEPMPMVPLQPPAMLPGMQTYFSSGSRSIGSGAMRKKWGVNCHKKPSNCRT